MNCDVCQQQLNAHLDGVTLGDSELLSLAAHVADCPECSADSLAISAQHAQLRDVFADVRPATARVINATLLQLLNASVEKSIVVSPVTSPAPAELVAHNSALPPHPSPLPSYRFQLLLAAAAGFLLALLLFRPWQRADVAEQQVPAPLNDDSLSQIPAPHSTIKNHDDPKQPKPAISRLAHLALATGPVEVRPAMLSTWATCPTSSDVEPGSLVRTSGGSKAEFAMSGGSQVRLNDNTAVKFNDDRNLELQTGQLWSCTTAQQKPFTITTRDTTITAQNAELYVTTTDNDAVLTVVKGSATIEGKAGEQSIAAGSKVRCFEGQVGEQHAAYDLLLDTGWITALLVMKGSESEELTKRTNDLLARLGEAKLSYLYEEEIRRLGEFGVTPLMRYVQADVTNPNDSKRAKAAQLIGDLAGVGSIPDLIELLSNPNANVRFQAARALQRLTGHDQGLPPGDWQKQSWDVSEPVARQWRQWWEQHRERYPTVREPAPQILKKG